MDKKWIKINLLAAHYQAGSVYDLSRSLEALLDQHLVDEKDQPYQLLYIRNRGFKFVQINFIKREDSQLGQMLSGDWVEDVASLSMQKNGRWTRTPSVVRNWIAEDAAEFTPAADPIISMRRGTALGRTGLC